MQIDQFIFKLLILSIPGSISYLLYVKIAIYRIENKTKFGFSEIMFILLSSLISNVIYDLFVKLLNCIFNLSITPVLEKLLKVGNYSAVELLFLIFIGIILGIIFVTLETKKVLYKIAKKLRFSNHYGDDDVWTFVCNSPDVEWVFVRDHKYDLVYFGRLEQYSDPGENRELLLSDVSVYTNKDSKYCYDIPKIYISRLPEELTIEIAPKKGEEDAT
ncbi:hypothetical protein [Gracilinema caldarium]|uniref:Uncharacterized protein n=1 Tax=Gracilinema caldarium (strain ATCC 51460 / DSM 7334 / H1) TaxID=744872 RepID=F8F301_GRAC1|nr:hypothetical protein [Gracilinema caldarium]AEJ19909.1 hypothetical protein Spica_1767 [Gracilinema caldarium DSM 7334]